MDVIVACDPRCIMEREGSGEHCQGSGIACPGRVHDVSLSLFDGGSREQAVAVFSDFNRFGF